MSACLLLHAVERMTGTEIWPGQMDLSLSQHCQDIRDGVSQAQIPLSQPGRYPAAAMTTLYYSIPPI
ncbi:uncharacterized [Tachysurus ichikawai]